MNKFIKSNYFLITNNPLQSVISCSLIKLLDLKNDNNICVNRSLSISSVNNLSDQFDDSFKIPMLNQENRILKWINFLIYISYVSYIILITRKKSKGNLIIGNLLYNGNRFIANFFGKYFLNIYILDEGSSTLNLFIERSSKRNNRRLKDKILLTYTPLRPLIFYSNFDLPILDNNYDFVVRVKNLFKALSLSKNINYNTVLFIGCPLVEAKIISLDYFNSLLHSLRENNPEADIIYIVHPKENLIFENPLVEALKITPRAVNMRLEDYLIKTPLYYSIIASTISTGYMYASDILGHSVNYQIFQLQEEKFLNDYSRKSANLIYSQMREKLTSALQTEIRV